MIVDAVLGAIGGLVGLGAIWAGLSVRVVQQFQKGVVFRFGRVRRRCANPGWWRCCRSRTSCAR